MPLRLIYGLFAFMLLIQSAHAEEITPWSFKGIMPKNAHVVQLTNANVTNEGIAISTQTDGFVVWPDHPLDGPVDVITVRARSQNGANAAVLWQPEGASDDELVQLYFAVPASASFQNIDVVVSGYPQWNWKTAQLAIALPAGSEVVIEEMQFRHWPFYERTVEQWKSFWTFDTFRPYSINFLWGPLVAGNTPSRLTLFDSLPPTAHSATRYMYILLGIVAAGAVIAGWKRTRRPQAFGWFLAAFALVWLIFDIRMSAEIVSYAVTDVQTYVLPRPAKKTLRNFHDVYARVDAMLPALEGHEKIALLVPAREVYDPVMRYRHYPRAVVTDPVAMSGATAWVIMDRTDMWVDEAGYLRQGNDASSAAVLAGPGRITRTINDTDFLFVTP